MDREGKPKSRASRAAVPCVEMLAKHLEEWRSESPYAGDDDWVFPSVRNKGKTPRSGSILVTDYLKKAAYEAGVLKQGEKVQFGMHNLRHSLATYLIAVGRDVKNCSNHFASRKPMTTLQLYAHGEARTAQTRRGNAHSVFRAADEAAYGCGAVAITGELRVSVFRVESYELPKTFILMRKYGGGGRIELPTYGL